jgi:hypothetical protein
MPPDGKSCASAFAGSCSFTLTGNGTQKLIVQTINRAGIAGDDINASVYATTSHLMVGGTYQFRVTVYYTDGTNQVATVNLSSGTYTWTQFSIPTLVATKNYSKIDIRIEFNKPSGSAAGFDAVSLKVSP